MSKVGLCVSEIGLNDYLNNTIPGERKTEIEKHLAECASCMDKLVFAYETVRDYEKRPGKGAKPMERGWKKNLWLLGAILAFTLSFLLPRYFVQLLVATILMGVKWIFDSVNARILIMIYDAWKKGGEQEASQILKKLGNRF